MLKKLPNEKTASDPVIINVKCFFFFVNFIFGTWMQSQNNWSDPNEQISFDAFAYSNKYFFGFNCMMHNVSDEI